MSGAYDAKDAMEVEHHDPKEGFDSSEPAAGLITIWVVVSVVTLVVVIGALQNYFNSIWDTAVEEKVLQAPAEQLQQLRNLEDWRLTHYEYTNPAETNVRLPLERGRELFLEELSRGESFYPGLPTAPEEPEEEVEAAEGLAENAAAAVNGAQ